MKEKLLKDALSSLFALLIYNISSMFILNLAWNSVIPFIFGLHQINLFQAFCLSWVASTLTKSIKIVTWDGEDVRAHMKYLDTVVKDYSESLCRQFERNKELKAKLKEANQQIIDIYSRGRI